MHALEIKTVSQGVPTSTTANVVVVSTCPRKKMKIIEWLVAHQIMDVHSCTSHLYLVEHFSLLHDCREPTRFCMQHEIQQTVLPKSAWCESVVGARHRHRYQSEYEPFISESANICIRIQHSALTLFVYPP